MPVESEGLTAALMQLAGLAEKLTSLDSREAADVREIHDRLTALATLAAGIRGTQEDQAEILRGLEGLDEAVAALAVRLDEVAPEDREARFYMSSASPRFWRLDGDEREAAVARLRAWVRDVYRPGYGWLSASLGECWEQHPLALYALDWLHELWSVLYLNEKRTVGVLSGQAEWQTRLMPAVAEQLARETTACGHVGVNGRPLNGALDPQRRAAS